MDLPRKHRWYGTEESADAIFQTVLHLFANLRKWKRDIVVVEGHTPDSVALYPSASEALDNALTKKRAKHTPKLLSCAIVPKPAILILAPDAARDTYGVPALGH